MPGARKKPFQHPDTLPFHRESIDAKPSPQPVPAAPPAAAPGPASGAAANGAPKPTPTPAMDQQWKCELKGLSADGKTITDLPEKISVGQKLALECDGTPSKIGRENLVIETWDTQKYSLHLLETRELGETKATLIVTPWRAGEWKVQNPALTDHKVRVGLGDFEYTVSTVIDPKTNPEGKPFPPLHPLTLAWPLWLWIFVAAIACGILYLLGLLVRKSLRRKKLLATLEANATALSPVNHFNKELRKLQRQIPLSGQTWSKDESRAYFKELDSQFRWFLARELVIPALDSSTGTILAELKKADRDVYKHSGRDLRVALLELRKAQSTSNESASEDALQLMELTRKVADQIAKERNV